MALLCFTNDVRKTNPSNVCYFRIILLYATREEAANILDWARERELTGNNFVWIVTQSVIGESKNGIAQTKPQFPVGMLGIIYHLLVHLSVQQNKFYFVPILTFDPDNNESLQSKQ